MPWLQESFAGPEMDPRLHWLHQPPSFMLGGRGLSLDTAAGTDFWQRTHYGFRADSGHALLSELAGDFRVETWVEFDPLHQYDQAGLLVRLSESCWLKTSIEFEPGQASRLGSVVTNDGWSDWATQDIDPARREARYRVTRRRGDYLIEQAEAPGRWTQLRLAHLREDDGTRTIAAGLYACSPKGDGFKAHFRLLEIERFG